MSNNIELPDSVDNALKNISNKVTENAGQTFGDIWYLVFGGISQAADKKRMKYAHDLKQYQQELEQAINSIPTDKKVEPSIQVTAQALENSKYCISSESLRKMFVNLISGTMNRNMGPHIHPSFPEIIKQMSSTDAEILKTFSKIPAQPIVNFISKMPNGTSRMIEKYMFLKEDGSFSPTYADAISSLERLGLLSVSFTSFLPENSLYEPFKQLPYFEHLQRTYETNKSQEHVDIKKGFCALTPLGHSFILVCVS